MIENSAKVVVAGVNFRKTTLEIRNKFALTTEHVKRIYSAGKSGDPGSYFILSTCNRTEIYSSNVNPEEVLSLLAAHSEASAKELAQCAFVKSGSEAVKHLFRVASGLDSQILGDYEIIGQLKNAFSLAKSYNKTSGFMERLVNSSLQASRQVKSKTALSDGTTSVSYAVIQLLKQTIGHEKPQNVCLMGLGKIGTLTLKNLVHYLPQHKIILVNRNETKAESTAGEYSVDFAPFASQQEVLKNADILIVATGADHPIIAKEDIAASGVKLIFDLSVPSNVAPQVKELDGVHLYNIDELSRIVNNAIDARKDEIPVAEAIIEEHFEEFKQWETRRSRYKLESTSKNHESPGLVA
ncbi:MAG: hemA [Bacteroidota bacterium]|nr:hemA [Bacteroidota bacterium]